MAVLESLLTTLLSLCVRKEKKNYAGSEIHSPHQLRKRSHFGTEYRKAPPRVCTSDYSFPPISRSDKMIKIIDNEMMR